MSEDKNSYQIKQRRISIEKFFWFCSGVNIEILSREDCETEHSKYSSIGAAVFLTAVMAFLSGSYALYTVFRNIFPAAGFGVLWSIIIFNLDRSIILNIRKGKNNTWEQVRAALPRLLLAVALGVVIAKPLELRLFSGEINQRILVEKNKKIDEEKAKIKEKGNAEIQLKKVSIAQLNTEIENQTAELKKQNNNLTWGRVERGEDLGTLTRQKQVDKLEADIKKLREEKESLEKELDSLTKSALDNVINSIEEEYKTSDGFLKQLATLEEISNENPRIALINWSITGLFVLIEILPILVKIMSRYGPYDSIVEANEETAIFRQSVRTEDFKEKILQDRKDNQNIRVQISAFLDAEFIKLLKEVLNKAEYAKLLSKSIEQRVIGTISGYSRFITNEITAGMKQPAQEAEKRVLKGLDDEMVAQAKLKEEILQVLNSEVENFRVKAKEIIQDYDQMFLDSEKVDLNEVLELKKTLDFGEGTLMESKVNRNSFHVNTESNESEDSDQNLASE